MSRVTIEGYVDGVSYILTADDATAEDAAITGIINSGAAPRAVAAMEAQTGETVAVTPTGPYVAAALDTIEGVVAAALGATEVTSISGDVPDWYGAEEDPTVDY